MKHFKVRIQISEGTRRWWHEELVQAEDGFFAIAKVAGRLRFDDLLDVEIQETEPERRLRFDDLTGSGDPT